MGPARMAQEPSILMSAPRLPSFVALLAPLLLTAACGRVQSADNTDPLVIKISTGSPTGNFRPFSEALARSYARSMPDVRIESVETPGTMHNIEALQDGTVDIGLAQAGIAYLAYNGQLNDRAMRHIRGIAVLNASDVHLMATPRSNMRSIDELRGRRIGIGPKGGALALTSQMVLRGYFSQEEVQEVSTTVPNTMAMLLDGRLDAAFTFASVPNDEAKSLTQGGARLLQLRGPAVDRLRTTSPFFRSSIIRSGSYPGQTEPVHTLSVDVVLLARQGLDDAVVRRLTESLFRMLPQLSAELPFLKGMVPERAPATPVPLHPGAALYYRERELTR